MIFSKNSKTDKLKGIMNQIGTKETINWAMRLAKRRFIEITTSLSDYLTKMRKNINYHTIGMII